MYGHDIDYFLSSCPEYGGVICSNQLPQKPAKRMYVINTSPCGVTDAGHWCVLDFTGEEPFFHDSVGKSAEFYGWPKMKYNRFRMQGNSDVCGCYAIHYVINRCKGVPFKTLMKPFTSNRKANDAYILKWMSEFPANT